MTVTGGDSRFAITFPHCHYWWHSLPASTVSFSSPFYLLAWGLWLWLVKRWWAQWACAWQLKKSRILKYLKIYNWFIADYIWLLLLFYEWFPKTRKNVNIQLIINRFAMRIADVFILALIIIPCRGVQQFVQWASTSATASYDTVSE